MRGTYSTPEAEILTLTLEDCILSFGQNEKPVTDPDFPGEDED
jgi:hypothetical protein